MNSNFIWAICCIHHCHYIVASVALANSTLNMKMTVLASYDKYRGDAISIIFNLLTFKTCLKLVNQA